MADVTAVAPTTPAERTWYDVAADEVAAALGVDADAGAVDRRGGVAARAVRPEQVRRGRRRSRAGTRSCASTATRCRSSCSSPASAASARSSSTAPASSCCCLTVFNAVLGLQPGGQGGRGRRGAPEDDDHQGARCAATAQLLEVPAEQLVPGDVVAIEAGDVVPADGRLLQAATLEVAESALTGESLPVSKGVEAVERRADVPLGDRTDMVYMNTNVHPRRRRVRRHRDRDGDRGRPHLRDAAGRGRRPTRR